MSLQLAGYSDQPTTSDKLGFGTSADALTRIIQTLELEETPLTIGVFGPWGSGKTSLMKMIEARLNDKQEPAFRIPIWFDAWRYAQQETLWRALLLSVVEGIRKRILHDDALLRALVVGDGQDNSALVAQEQKNLETKLDDLVASLYRSVEREELGGIEIDWGEAAKVAGRLAVRASFAFVPVLGTLTKAVEEAWKGIGSGQDVGDALGNVLKRERSKIYRDHVVSLDQFQTELRDLVKQWFADRGRRLVIFIDDLDRCLPEQAVGVLEAIKVFLDIPGCVFVLGMDRDVIELGIRVRYKEFALASDHAERDGRYSRGLPVLGREYLDKIVQLAFELPALETQAMAAFLLERLRMYSWADGTPQNVATLMAAGLAPNPRKVKRTLNTFRLLMELGHAHGRNLEPTLLAKLVVLQSSYLPLYMRVASEPRNLTLIEYIAREVAKDQASGEALMKECFHESYVYYFDERRQQPKLAYQVLNRAAPRLLNMMKEGASFADLDSDKLHDLVYLSRTTDTSLSPQTNLPSKVEAID